MNKQTHPTTDSDQSFRIVLLTKRYGKWTLGFSWDNWSLGGSRGVPGLALYAKKDDAEAERYVCFTLKECMCFWERNKVPPKKAATLLHEAFKHGNWQ